MLLTIKRPNSSKKHLCGTSFLLKESLIYIFLEIDPLNIIALFFVDYFYTLPFNKKFTFSSNIFAITMCSTSTCFYKKIFHLYYNKKKILSLFEFLNLFLSHVLNNKDTTHDWCILKINFYIIIDIIKTLTQRQYSM